MPTSEPSRASGQSALMSQTFAGQNKCNPKQHDRPFIIEWDATDMSQFESIAASDVVFVRYEGCELRVIDSCRNDSIKGALGSYKPIEWTSGSVEKINIANEGDLVAKLPLGVATLGGRVSAGERFHMEYFVSGTRAATRPAVLKGDLQKVPGCRGVTHFVYAYNLGAFALGSAKNIQGSLDTTIWGAGVGGKTSQSNAAEKRGGMLESCRGESAKELTTCKVPVRLTLRELEDGTDEDVAAAAAPETPSALHLAGKVDAKMKRNERAQAHIDAAGERRQARDGKACVAELDKADQLDPRPFILSTNPRSYWANVRATCIMLSGQCAAGRQLYRKHLESNNAGQLGPEQIDSVVDAIAAMNCQGGSMSPRDQLLSSYQTLMASTQTKKDPAHCKSSYDRLKKAALAVTHQDDEAVERAKTGHERLVAQCLGKAGDCQSAWEYLRKENAASTGAFFKTIIPACKSYEPPTEGGLADASVVHQRRARAMSEGLAKAMSKDATCVASFAEYDRLADAADRGAPSTHRAICLMVAGRCDEGERVQRSVLAQSKVAQNIMDLNIKSLRHDWCK